MMKLVYVQHDYEEKKKGKKQEKKEVSSTMRFELTRAKPNGLAGRRLNHSATSTLPLIVNLRQNFLHIKLYNKV